MSKKSTKTSKAGKNQKLNTIVTPEVNPHELVEGVTNEGMEKPTETPQVKQLKKSLSDAELQERLATARTRKGEIVNFLCTKTQEWTIGLIRTARLDKRSGFIQFRIEVLEFPAEGENSEAFEGATGNWLVDDKIECPVRRTNILWGKGDDSTELKVVGHYAALPKATKEEEPTEETPQEPVKPAKKGKKTNKKITPKQLEEEAAKAAAMADMTAEGLM